MNAPGQIIDMPSTRGLAYLPESRSLTAANVREHVNLIQEVMAAVMKKDTHYGVIPGCKLPSLYKAGSEVLLATFRIAVSVHVDDLSTDDAIRYRVRTVGTHQGTGIVVGEGIGECSSNEEKYKWRKCWTKEEFDATPETRRRMKFTRSGKEMQIRTEPADLANTVLKMAKKRGLIDGVLTVTAASDLFTQDIEDLPEEVIAEIVGQHSKPGKHASAPPPDSPERAAADKEARDVASLGVDAFRAMWAAWPKEKRALVTDLLPAFKVLAEKVDASRATAEVE
jgi:hypothetical protein